MRRKRSRSGTGPGDIQAPLATAPADAPENSPRSDRPSIENLERFMAREDLDDQTYGRVRALIDRLKLEEALARHSEPRSRGRAKIAAERKRERDALRPKVLEMIGGGMGLKTVAAELGFSETTIRKIRDGK